MIKKITHLSIYLSVFLIPFYFFRFNVLGLPTNIVETSILISFILTLINLKQTRKLVLSSYVLPLLFLLTVFISIFIGGFSLDSAGIFKGWFLAPMIFSWVVYKNMTEKDLPYLSFCLFLSLQIISFVALLQNFNLATTFFYQVGDASFSQYLIEKRVFSFFESPNYLAMFLVPAIFIAFPAGEKIKLRVYKIIFYTSFILPVIVLWFSASRAGVLAFIAAAVFYFNYRLINTQKAANRRPIFAGFLVALLGLINISYVYYAVRFFTPNRGGDSIRIEIYDYAVKLIAAHPFLGVGLGKFREGIAIISSGNISFQQFALHYALHPHNLMLAVWLNTGILGLVLFIWLLVTILRNVFSTNSPYRASVIAALAAIVVHGLFDTTYFKNDLALIFWLVFAISLVIKKDQQPTT